MAGFNRSPWGAVFLSQVLIRSCITSSTCAPSALDLSQRSRAWLVLNRKPDSFAEAGPPLSYLGDDERDMIAGRAAGMKVECIRGIPVTHADGGELCTP
jgi:hypothetical protein